LVETAEVAGAQPVGVEGGGRLLRPAVVADHQRDSPLPPDADLALRPRRQLLPVVVEDADGPAPARPPDAGDAPVAVDGCRRGDGRTSRTQRNRPRRPSTGARA